MELFYCYAYGRLSKEDGDKIESDSIKNQRDLIHSYIGQHPELKLVMEGYDDGYTGTNFERPCFKEMLEAVKEQKVNCVIVKDLSRFGREYIEAGRYIEKLFPALGVRFIAINDGYDTAHLDASSSLILPFKNLINDSYCRDTSIKVRSHFDVKRRNGEFIGSFAAYGYSKDPENKNRLVVDPEAADVVREIFARRISGMSCQAIADELNTLGVPSPMEYKRSRGMKYKSGYRVHNKTRWSATAVRRILQNEVYLGVMEQGKRTTPNYKVKTVVYRPPEEWMRVEDTHEAIISRELFAAVQKALDQAAQQAKDREIHSWSPNLLKGKIFCAHCGHSLHRQKCVRRKTPEVYVYHCISNNRIKKGVCPGAFIFEKELLDALADMIQEQLDTTLGQYSLGLENLTKEAEEQKNIQAKIASRKQEIQQLRTYQRGLYEGLIQNHLSKDEYFTFKEKYESKIEAISEEIEQLKAGLAILAKQLEQYKMLSQDAQHIKEDRQLTAALIDRLIDRVEVSREKRITVRFRFQSEFEHCEEVLSQCRNM